MDRRLFFAAVGGAVASLLGMSKAAAEDPTRHRTLSVGGIAFADRYVNSLQVGDEEDFPGRGKPEDLMVLRSASRVVILNRLRDDSYAVISVTKLRSERI